MEFVDLYLNVLKTKYAAFDGRARRKEYWGFTIINISIAIILGIIGGIIKFTFLSVIFWLAVLLPSIAIGVRRLHDIGKSGWWLLIALVPIVGALYLLYLMVQDSNPGDNQYGANPKEAS